MGTIPEEYDCYWLTTRTTVTEDALKDKEHVFLVNFQPTRAWTLAVNTVQALWWVMAKRPKAIITTGAGVAVPTVYLAKKLLGTKVVFINTAADVTTPSRTPRWIERYADLFLVQWEEMLKVFPRATCCGVL